MHAFEYLAPATLAEAVRAMASAPGPVSLLAGGTDLIVGMRGGRTRPARVVDVKQIAELSAISLSDDQVEIGAAVTCGRIYRHPELAAVVPALVESARLIGGIQIQNRATLGGNLCNASPSADLIPSLIAYGATAIVAGAGGRRALAVEQFCTAPGRTALAAGELLLQLRMPRPAADSGAAFLRFTPRREMDIAEVNVGVFVQLDTRRERFAAVRIALGAVAPRPLLVGAAGEQLAGQPVSAQAIDDAAALCVTQAQPIPDMRGTVAHRRQLIRVLVARALKRAVGRARGGAA